jgi:hypothetical protein
MHTPRAVTAKTAGINLCTRHFHSADDYLYLGPIYLIQDKISGESYQLSLTPWELRDIDNKHVHIEHLGDANANPGISHNFVEYRARDDRRGCLHNDSARS